MTLNPKAEYETVDYSSANYPFVVMRNMKINSDNTFKLAWHEEMEIKYIVSGSMYVNIGKERVHAKEGDIVIINPCEHHLNQMESGTDAVYHLLCVDLSRVFNDAVLKGGAIPYKSINMRFNNLIRNDDTAKKYIELFFESSSQNDTLLSLGLFLAFFASIEPHVDSQKTINVGNRHYMIQEEIVNNALFYIHSHYREQIVVKDIANMCYVSESHFCRVFKEFTGETPVFYINRLRIDKAISIMKSTNEAVSQIAQEVGFSEETYFCKCFKKYTGLSPRQYRKNCSDAEGDSDKQ